VGAVLGVLRGGGGKVVTGSGGRVRPGGSTMSTDPSVWRRCSTCKSDIGFGKKHFVCSVSTCNRKRTGLAFCSVECWDAHLPTARHRDAWAVEKVSPRQGG